MIFYIQLSEEINTIIKDINPERATKDNLIRFQQKLLNFHQIYLKEYNTRTIFLEKTYPKWGGDSIFRPFSKKSKLRVSLDKSFYIVLYSLSIWGLLKHIETKMQTTCFYLIKSFFKKIKRDLELVFLPHFWHDFWRKTFFLLYSITWPNFIVCLPLLRKIFGNMPILIVG